MARALRTRSSSVALLAAGLVVTATACGTDTGSESSGGDGLTKVLAAPPAPVPGGFPSYWLAEGYGFFEAECLDVEMVDPGQAATPALRTDRLDIAGIGMTELVPLAAADEDMGVKAFMATDVLSMIFVTFEDSGFTSIADLKGQKIGINEPHDEIDAQILLSSAGLEPGDYEIVPVGEDRAALLAMERGDVPVFMAAIRGAKTVLPGLASKPIRILQNESLDQYYNGTVVATDKFLEENRDTAVRFARALARAMVWQWENPDLSAEILLEQAPEAADNVEKMSESLQVGSAHHQPVYDDQMTIDGDLVQGYVDLVSELGLIEESFDASGIYTTDLMDEILDFDIEAEKAAARSATEAPAIERSCG